MSGKAKMKQKAPARKRVTKRERMMTDKESSDLLESASQALAMIRGSKLVGGRISVDERWGLSRHNGTKTRRCTKEHVVELRVFVP